MSKEMTGAGIPEIRDRKDLVGPLTVEVYHVLVKDADGKRWRETSFGMVEELCNPGKMVFSMPAEMFDYCQRSGQDDQL